MKPNQHFVAAIVILLAAGSPERASVADSKNPAADFVPANVADKVDNPWFPLIPGTILTYQGTKDDESAVRILTVTNEKRMIEGVSCVVVEEQVSLGSSLAEKAQTYYAQDQQGNVWVLGEEWQEIEHGRVVKTESWQAGADGASPSFFMENAPVIGHAFGHAYTDSNFEIVSLSESVKVPYNSFTDALLTKEWSPEEPDVLTHKYYARGVGEIRDVAVKGPHEEFVLVRVAQ